MSWLLIYQNDGIAVLASIIYCILGLCTFYKATDAANFDILGSVLILVALPLAFFAFMFVFAFVPKFIFVFAIILTTGTVR